MSEILEALGKTKKVTLPLGWVERFSKKHPDQPYYFNENTGESRWSPPVNPEDMKNSDRKGKKRKIADEKTGRFSDMSPDGAEQLLNEITARPKLKARVSRVISPKESSNKDTPAMRLYREKLAQRKEAQLKKSISKLANKKSSQTKTKSTDDDSKSVTSSDALSECSTVSNASSLGSKIKKAATTVTQSQSKDRVNIRLPPAKRLAKIRKISAVSTNISSKTDVSDSNISCDIRSDTEGSKDVTNDIATRSSMRKNSANERLESFRKSLSSERNKSLSPKYLNKSPSVKNNRMNASINKSKLDFSSPSLCKRAQVRLCSLEKRVQNHGIIELHNIEQTKNDKEEENVKNEKLLEKVCEVSNVFCEKMDWEPIEDEKLMSEVYSARFELYEKPTEHSNSTNVISNNPLKLVDVPGEKNTLYIVIDTNVYLSNLSFVEEVRDSSSNIFGRPFIVVPWTVLQELDFIKDDKNNVRSQALKLKARNAVEFLNRHFTAKHPRFLGQTPADVEKNRKKFVIECPDDDILQTCLQIKESSKSPVLLSYDKNLCTKAMIHDIPVLGRNDPLEKIYYLKAAETEFLSNSLHAHTEENQEDTSIIQKELLAADDIMEEGKAILKSVLSEVVSKEMEELFGSRWEKHVIIHPPWSVDTVLKCALKHWMAAVSESFTRKAEPILRDLQLCIRNTPEGGRKLQDVKLFLDKCSDLFQTLNSIKHSLLKDKTIAQINDLKQRCLSTNDELNNARLQESIGSVETESEEEQRASLAFKVFEEVYAFARDACGIAADALGLQCAFAYNKFHPSLPPKVALRQQQDIGINVNRLLQILKLSLSMDDSKIVTDDKIIMSMYGILVSFSPIWHIEELSKLTPLDLFCCIKLKRPKLEKGYEQLQELAVHFCRMANFQCT